MKAEEITAILSGMVKDLSKERLVRGMRLLVHFSKQPGKPGNF